MQQDLGKFRWRAAEEGNRRRKSRTKVRGKKRAAQLAAAAQRHQTRERARAVGQQTGNQRLLAGGVCGCTCWNNWKCCDK